MPISTPQNFSCPQCGQVDMVQKVSALVEGGTIAGRYSTRGGTPISVVPLSAKASQLAPPPAPTFINRPWGFFSVLFVIAGFAGGLWTLGAFLLGLFLPIGVDMPVFGGQFDSPDQKTSILFGVFIISVVCFAIALSIILWKKHNKRKKAQYEIKKAQWVLAMSRWDKLYYCSRNDVVFIPGKAGACVPAFQMARLLT